MKKNKKTNKKTKKQKKGGGWFGSKSHPPLPHGHIPEHIPGHPMHEQHHQYDPTKGHTQFIPEHHGTYDPKTHGAYHPEHHGAYDPKIHGAYDPKIHGTFHQDIHGTFDPTKHGAYNANIHGQIIHSPHLQSIQSNLAHHHMDVQTKQSIINKLKVMQKHNSGQTLTPNESKIHQNHTIDLGHLKLGKGPGAIKNTHIKSATSNLNSARQKLLQFGISQKLVKPENKTQYTSKSTYTANYLKNANKRSKNTQLVNSIKNKLLGFQKEHDIETQRLASTPFSQLQALNPTKKRPTNSGPLVKNTSNLEGSLKPSQPSAEQKKLLQNIQNKNKQIITTHGLNKEPDINTKLRSDFEKAQQSVLDVNIHGVQVSNEQKKIY